MATDNTPPRLRLIVTIAVITVVTLVSLDFVLKSYYAFMSDQAARGKLAPATDLEAHRKLEEVALTNAKIDQVTLTATARPEIIATQQSQDIGPVTGWSKAPKPAPAAPQVGSAPIEAADGGAQSDGGVRAGDGGAAPLATDAGAPQAKPDAGAAQNKPDAAAPILPTPRH